VFADALSKGDALPISGKEMLKRETIPLHKELKKGLEKSLLKRLESEE